MTGEQIVRVIGSIFLATDDYGSVIPLERLPNTIELCNKKLLHAYHLPHMLAQFYAIKSPISLLFLPQRKVRIYWALGSLFYPSEIPLMSTALYPTPSKPQGNQNQMID